MAANNLVGATAFPVAEPTSQKIMRCTVYFAATCLLLAGCAGNPPLGDPRYPSAVRVAEDLPPPSGQDLIPSVQPYVIGPLDKLTVSVFGVEELSGNVQADASGRITLPLIGTIKAVGLTPDQLSRTVAAAYRRYVRDPVVAVSLREATSQTFTVDGQVTEPGIYPVVGNMSLVRAVATAKGASEFAKLDDVVVFRTVNGQRMAALYNLGAIRRGVYADPRIYSNDVIVVGESRSRRLFKDFLQIAPALATPIVLLLQNN